MKKTYTLKYRRRREGKTNYHRRLRLLKGRKPRLVVRKSNSNVVVQVIQYQPDGDMIIAQTSTDSLKKIGWSHNTGNIPAAYMAGFTAGAAALKAGIKDAVVDFGMQMPFHGGRLFAAVKGAIDAGLNIPASDSAFPSDDRLQGAHIDEKVAKTIETMKGKVA